MTTWTVACQTPLSVEFSRQEYWSGWIEPRSPELQVDSLLSEPPGKPQDVNINNFMKGNIWSLGCLQSCKLKHILHGICVLFETLFEKCHTGIRSKSKLGSGLPKVCILHISSPGGGT